ncbi:MAG: hypothetical protein JRJ84_13915 [Deltaproteobacteria bacterium]|nr:hypothetical protein [Deltaproteobacteria bacterium]
MRRTLANPLVLVTAALLANGCWVSEKEIRGVIGNDTDTAEPGPVDITALEPDYGTAAGGTEVSIEASPVGAGVKVQFAGSEAAVLGVEGSTVLVRTPPGTAGLADVDIQWGAKTGTRVEGFRYWPDGTGRYGALGSVAWFDIVGTLDDLTGWDDTGFAWVNFIQPSIYGYDAVYGPALDTCASGWGYPGVVDEQSGASQIHISRTGGSLELNWDASSERFEADLVEEGGGANAFAAGETWDLEEMAGAQPWPPISVAGMVETPVAFTVTTPSLAAGTPPSVFQFDFDIEWSAANTADYVVIRLDLWQSDFSAVEEQVRCLARDDGSFTVPSAAWQTLALEIRSLDVYVGRVRASEATLPHDASTSGVVGVYWVVGEVAFWPL